MPSGAGQAADARPAAEDHRRRRALDGLALLPHRRDRDEQHGSSRTTPPGWTAKELVDELVARPARVVGFDFPFCVPHALLRDRSSPSTSATRTARSSAGAPSTGGSRSASRSPTRSTSRPSPRGETAPSARGSGRSARRTSPPVDSRRHGPRKLQVEVCTAILHTENGWRPVLAPDPTWQEKLVKVWEGAIWVPTITTSPPA